MRFASAICSAMAIMLAGYIPSILANYHFHLRLMKQRTNPTPLGRCIHSHNPCRSATAFVLSYRV